MFRRDNNYHIMIIQDNSAKDLYDVSDFVDKINGVIALVFEKKEEGRVLPELYRNEMLRMTSENDYNKFVDERVLFRMQMKSLVRTLMLKHLPVVLPDYEYFQKEYERIGKIEDPNVYDEELKRNTLEYRKSILVCSEMNELCAKKHGIPYPKIEDVDKFSNKNKEK